MIEKNPIKFLISYTKKYFPYFILFILFNIISHYINDITIPKYIGLIIESIKTNFNHFNIQNLLLLVIICNVLYIAFDVLARCFYILSFTKTKNNMIKTLFHNVEQYELSFFNNNLSGLIGNKIIDLAKLSERFLFDLINIITVNLILKVCILYSFYKINTLLAVINLSWIVLYISMIFCLNKYFKIRIKNYEEQKNKINGTIIDALLNVINIKLFSRETYELDLLNDNLNISYKKESSSIFMKIFIKLVCNILSSLPLIINLWLSLYLYKLNSLNVGNIVYIVITSLNIIQTTKFIGNIIIENLEQYNKIKYNLENIVVNPTIINYTDKPLTLTTSSITFSNISFQYSNNLPLVFNQLNLSIPSKQKVGIE